MSDGLARLDLGRSGVDPALGWDMSAPAAILTGTAPSPRTLGAGKVLPQRPACLGVGVDVLVDRFRAHPRPSLKPRSPADDRRRPAFFEPRLGIRPHLIGEAPRARSLGLGVRLFVSVCWPVASQPRVAPDLAADAAWIA